jgi:hypothetical protein
LAQVIVALLMLSLTRAQGAYAIVAVLPLLAIGQRGRLPAIAISLAAYLLVIFGYGQLHASMSRSATDPTRPIDVSLFGISDVTGKVLFFMVYPAIYPGLKQSAVAPENGPASRRLFAELKDVFSTADNLSAIMGEQRSSQFAGRLDKVVETMQREPDVIFFNLARAGQPARGR